jgi:hypothetical protein
MTVCPPNCEAGKRWGMKFLEHHPIADHVLDVVGDHCQKVGDELSAIARMAQRCEGLPRGRT